MMMMMMMDASGLGSFCIFTDSPAGEITAIENQSPPGMVPRLGGNKPMGPMGFAKEKHLETASLAIPSHKKKSLRNHNKLYYMGAVPGCSRYIYIYITIYI